MDEGALLGLAPQADAQAQQRALQYFEQLKSAREGWQVCANALSSGVYAEHDHIKFFCFQVIENYLKTSYVSSTQEEHQAMKSFLRTWLHMQIQGGVQEKSFLRNKAAQILSLVFVCDYPARWPSFLADLLQLLPLGEMAVDVYLRTMMAIDSEVVDREIGHTPQETERNTLIKDSLRQQCVPQLVESWYHIITTYETSNAELVCQCLQVIGAYISWIDITLIANDKFVSTLLRFMSAPLLRESACDCIHEIILKGMDPLAKTKLIESFITVLENAGLLSIQEDDEEGDYLAKLGKLINGIGLQLILCWQKLVKAKELESAKVPLAALEAKVPLMLRFLSCEDDDVSGTVTQFAHDYITTLKQLAPLKEGHKQCVKNLLFVIMKKMKFDESYNFESEGEDEAMFQEYRKELRVIFNNLGALDSDLLLSSVHELFSTMVTQWQDAKYQDVELAITLLYNLAEALPSSQGQHFTGDVDKVTRLQQMMRQLVSSRVSFFRHPAVALQFFETVTRYDKFFNIEPEFVPDVLMAFLDERGLRNPSSHVRSRAAYLFSRFVRAVNKQHFADYLEEMLRRCEDLLVLHTPDNGLSRGRGLSPDDQLFMYETAGVLVVNSSASPEKKQALMRQLLAPIVGKYDNLVQSMLSETNPVRQQQYAQSISHGLSFASRTSKGFSNQQTMQNCGCVEVYTDTLKVFLGGLDVPVHRPLLHAGIRQFLHRMVVCLDTAVLPFIPLAMENLLKNADARELHDFIPLINQVVIKFKKHILPFLAEVFMPIVRTIFNVLAAPLDERDQVGATERRMLQRGYYSFLATLVNNNVADVLAKQEAASLHQVLLTVVEGAVDFPDPQSQKTCFSILSKLVTQWGAADTGLNGFEDFMYKSIVPACFMAPMKPTFDLSDAQTILALNESAACMKTMLDKRGNEFVNFLQNSYLPTLSLAPEICQEYCQALKSEPKVFRTYVKAFFVRAKS